MIQEARTSRLLIPMALLRKRSGRRVDGHELFPPAHPGIRFQEGVRGERFGGRNRTLAAPRTMKGKSGRSAGRSAP